MDVSLVKKGNTLDKIISDLSTMNSYSIEVGFFEEDGKHSSGMTYSGLMFLHHQGTGIGQGEIPPRPVLDFLEQRLFSSGKFKSYIIKRALKNLISSPVKNKHELDVIAKQIKEEEERIFGKDGPLLKNSSKTIALKGRNDPLIDTGELLSKLRAKVNK